MIEHVRPTAFKTFKVEALHGDFFWLDDQPTAYEFEYLDKRGWLDRWLQVNTRQDFEGLLDVMDYLVKRQA